MEEALGESGFDLEGGVRGRMGGTAKETRSGGGGILGVEVTMAEHFPETQSQQVFRNGNDRRMRVCEQLRSLEVGESRREIALMEEGQSMVERMEGITGKNIGGLSAEADRRGSAVLFQQPGNEPNQNDNFPSMCARTAGGPEAFQELVEQRFGFGRPV